MLKLNKRKALSVCLFLLLALSFLSVFKVANIPIVKATTDTFGHTGTEGGHLETIYNTIVLGVGTPTSSGNVTKITVKLYSNWGDPIHIKCALYNFTTGSFITNSATDERSDLTGDSHPQGVFDFTYSGTAPTVVAGKEYCIGCWCDHDAVWVEGALGTGYYNASTYGTFPSSISVGGLSTTLDIYATYTVTGGGGGGGKSGAEMIAEISAVANYYVFQPNATFYGLDSVGQTVSSGSDASTVIQATIDEMSSKQTIFLNGTFPLTDTVTPLTSNLFIDCRNATFISDTGLANYMFNIYASNITFSGGHFDGDAYVVSALRVYGSFSDTKILNNDFQYFADTVISLQGISGDLVQNNTFSNNIGCWAIGVYSSDSLITNNIIDCGHNGGGIGDWSDGSSSNVNVTRNQIINWGKAGTGTFYHAIYFEAVSNSYWEYNTGYSTGTADMGVPLLIKAENITIRHNVFIEGYDWALHAYQQHDYPHSNPINLKVYNNTFTNFNLGGIILGGGLTDPSTGTEVYNNTISDCGTGSSGIDFWGDVPSAQIHDNKIINCGIGLRTGYPWPSYGYNNDLNVTANLFQDITGLATGSTTVWVLTNSTGCLFLGNTAINCTNPIVNNEGTNTIFYGNINGTLHDNWGFANASGYHTLTMLEPTFGGSVNPDVGIYIYSDDQTAQLTATVEEEGYIFVAWEINGINETTNENVWNVLMTEDHIAKAYFFEGEYTISLIITNPQVATYITSSVPVALSVSGNDTNPVYSWNVWLSNATWMYGVNKTTTSDTMLIYENFTATFCCHVVGDNLAEDYGEVEFTVEIPNAVYTLSLIITNPQVATYITSSVPVALSISGNDTNPVYSWNFYFANATTLYVSNQTGSSATMTINENCTGTFACKVTGDNGAYDYGEVELTVNILPYVPPLVFPNPFAPFSFPNIFSNAYVALGMLIFLPIVFIASMLIGLLTGRLRLNPMHMMMAIALCFVCVVLVVVGVYIINSLQGLFP